MFDSEKFTLETIGAFLNKLAEKSESVYWLSSQDFEKIEYMSPAYEKIWGRPREELYANPEKWTSFLHPEDRKSSHPIQTMLGKMQTLGAAARYDESYRIVKPNGEIRWIIDRGFPIYDSSGICHGITGVAVDVTAEKLQQLAITKAKEAELATQSKIDFLMNMRHDFRTPFSGILSLSEILAEQEADVEKKENLNMIASSAKNLLEQLNELFELISLEESTLPTLDKAFDVHQFFTEIESIMKPAAITKGLQFTIEWNKKIPQYLIGDRMKTQRIFMNLISNSIKFTDKGSVLINADLERVQANTCIIKFTFKDTGIGIPEDKSEYIFQRFTRLKHSYTGVHPGKGYGLRIVKQFLDDLGGEVYVKSSVGEGAVFTIFIPYKISLIDCHSYVP